MISKASSVRLFTVLALLVLTSSQICYVADCSSCTTDGEVCLLCNEGFSSTLFGTCVAGTITNCENYLNSTSCIKCLPGYKLQNNTCIRNITSCIEPLDGSLCKTCFPQFTNINNTCKGTFNCLTYKNGVCQSCTSGFTYIGGRCLANPQNCRSVDPTYGICLECQPGYRMVGYKCILQGIQARNCKLWDQNGKCYYCQLFYVLKNGVCRMQGANSATPSLQGGQGNVQPNTISQNAAGTVNLNSQSTQNTQNTPNSQNPASSLTTTAVSNTEANLAKVMSKLNVQCSKLQNQTCVECYPSYYLDKDGVCKLISTLCKQFNHDLRRCEACYRGYKLSANFNCIIAPPQYRDPRCKVLEHETCVQCYNQFHLFNGVCRPNNPLCKGINSDGSCKACYRGYALVNGSCISSLSKVDRFCIVEQNNLCQTCVNGYYVDSESGRCKPTNLNCQENDNQGQCTSCLPNYLLVGGNCVVPIKKCTEYKSNGQCIACDTGYFLSQKTYGICYPKDITCSSYDSNGNCQTCIATYHIFKGKCIFPAFGFDSQCGEYVNGYCTSCVSGYFLWHYKCRKIDVNCREFDEKKKKCLVCNVDKNPSGPFCL